LLTSLLTDIKSKISVAAELRDSIEFIQRDGDPAKFFDALLPAIINLLANGKPSLVNLAPDNVSNNLHPSHLNLGLIAYPAA
jgi:hypothetical protein